MSQDVPMALAGREAFGKLYSLSHRVQNVARICKHETPKLLGYSRGAEVQEYRTLQIPPS